jgi:hypothetical protein
LIEYNKKLLHAGKDLEGIDVEKIKKLIEKGAGIGSRDELYVRSTTPGSPNDLQTIIEDVIDTKDKSSAEN